MKHNDFAKKLEELGHTIKIKYEPLPPNLPVYPPDPIPDHYGTFLGDSEVSSNVIGQDCGKFLGMPIDTDEF